MSKNDRDPGEHRVSDRRHNARRQMTTLGCSLWLGGVLFFLLLLWLLVFA